MYRNKKISLVIPAYNEENLIRDTLSNLPPCFDYIYVVDDLSPDHQNKIIEEVAVHDPRIHLLKHTVNQGPGGAIITGYLQSNLDGNDIAVVVGGDNQMDLNEVENFLNPVIDGKTDYAKGNRFLLKELEHTLDSMPKTRLIPNWIITFITKIASGNYRIMDVVDGYTAISRNAIDTINWNKAWKGYGYPMDFLIRINAYGFRVMDIPRKAIYLPGVRQSQIKGLQYALKVSPMLWKGFLWRLKFKYLYLNFHPVILFYLMSFVLLPLGLISSSFLAYDKLFLDGASVTAPRSIFSALLVLSGLNFLLFALVFDIQEDQSSKQEHF